ncbi:tetratricopeptide repeat protein [Bdellovibrio sp. KM01]|uniref:tetratricopeptide repeat protein n=1 Tax=Bdellovibrio sp. KM01 TaxID=2748865 RepID=UPI0015EA8FF4|nr:tetratricopeptide repeat protein [Bdellovibrio sp. KM01]QLY26318.1 tetratricopeptide repeat protein [Bdellovibrio sp. KM01]
MKMTEDIYEMLVASPEEANKMALLLLQSVHSQEEKDSINWARAFALVEMKEFPEALEIWQEIFDRTHDHKALHQIGYVHRSAGNLPMAVNVFNQEYALIAQTDKQSLAVNLYEQTYCHILLGYHRKAVEMFSLYENLKMGEFDLIERGCFFRLKGDLFKSTDKNVAKEAYEQSIQFFTQAKDETAVLEVQQKLSSVG